MTNMDSEPNDPRADIERQFRLRESLNEVDPVHASSAEIFTILEEALINCRFLLGCEEDDSLHSSEPWSARENPERVGTSVTNTNPDYSGNSRFPFGFPVGINLFQRNSHKGPSKFQRDGLRGLIDILIEAIRPFGMLGSNPAQGKGRVSQMEEQIRSAKLLLYKIEESTVFTPLADQESTRFGLVNEELEVCRLCRVVICENCSALEQERYQRTARINALRTSLSEQQEIIHLQRSALREMYLLLGRLKGWYQVARKRLSKNIQSWHTKITHER